MSHDIDKPSPGAVADSFGMNVASRLAIQALRQPNNLAIASPLGKYYPGTKRAYREMTFSQLELHTNSIAAGLQALGIGPGMRIVLAVRFGLDFIALVFALLKVGAVVVLIDRGNGLYGFVDSRREAERQMVKQLTGNLMTVAKDVKIQVEFNPEKVRAYRLIGYENRQMAAADFNNDKKDAGEIDPQGSRPIAGLDRQRNRAVDL